MNVGYGTTKSLYENSVCPLCGKNIYVSKYGNDYACVDKECKLGHGAKALIQEIQNVLNDV